MRRRINAFIRLFRYKEYLAFVVVTTLLGATAAIGGEFNWKLAGVVIANQLAVAFAFMINDVEDADDDALTPHKCQRNPVSCADLDRRTAFWSSIGIGLLSLFVYALVGLKPFLVGLACVVIGFLYSWRRVRFKNLAIVDMLSHGMMLAGFQFFAGYFTFEPSPITRWLFPFLFVYCISLYGELFNEMRDLEGDLKAGLRHTASVLGPKVTSILMATMMGIGCVSGLITAFVIKLIASWVLWLVLILAIIYIIPALIRVRRHKSGLKLQESFQKPLEFAAATALSVQFAWPWVVTNYSWIFNAYILPWFTRLKGFGF